MGNIKRVNSNKFEENQEAKEAKEEKKNKNVHLKSEMFNHDSEKIERRDDNGPSDAMMWGFVIGFALFFVLLICIIIFTN